jgi:hypothetical protein
MSADDIDNCRRTSGSSRPFAVRNDRITLRDEKTDGSKSQMIRNSTGE